MERLKELGWLFIKEWVVLGMIVVGILAYFFPHVGSKDGPLRIDIVNPILIGLTFFCIGLPMSIHSLKNALLNWKSHLLIQGTVFIMFPIFTYGVTGLLFHFIGGEYFPFPVALGVVITGSLPTTFDTGVIYSKICEADESLSVLNGTLSNLLGMLLTPLLLYIQLNSAIPLSSFQDVFLHLVEIALAPFLVSQLVHFGLHYMNWITDNVKKFFGFLSIVPKLVLVWLTFTTMCSTFLAKYSITASAIAITIAFLTFIHFFMAFFVMGYLACFIKSGVKFTRKEIVTHVFLGSQKVMTLAIPIGMSPYFIFSLLLIS
jgi:sodium/bile acid cotransporter 7